ncbi:hypothetical protein ACFXPI_12110 [Streptomyces sp. NPDC059104]|uniref:hypothetical protein n=1 Tax=Streptomyces sp. NPDC059104 TaxID=3346729 RepID=UPI003684C456
MRSRHALTAATSALLLALPTSAHAATGDFNYKTSTGQSTGIADPDSSICINLPGTSEEAPGNSPENLTSSTATVFTETDCNGDTYTVMNPGKRLDANTQIRSVIFS